jgi:hypothetical protein
MSREARRGCEDGVEMIPDSGSSVPTPARVGEDAAALRVSPALGLAGAEVDVRLGQHGFNEVRETTCRPIVGFLTTSLSATCSRLAKENETCCFAVY